jgi:hypothetical protein
MRPPRRDKITDIKKSYSGLTVLEETFAIGEADWFYVENAATSVWKDLTFALFGGALGLIVAAFATGANPLKDIPYLYFLWAGTVLLAVGALCGVFWVKQMRQLKQMFDRIKKDRGIAVLDWAAGTFSVLRKPKK